VPNPNVVILEEIFDEENFDNFDQEAEIIQDESLESVQMDEGESSLYIFYEHEESYISQENVVQTRAQVNRFKTKETVEKEKEKNKTNVAETSKQQTSFQSNKESSTDDL
jgi:hypothetical protein